MKHGIVDGDLFAKRKIFLQVEILLRGQPVISTLQLHNLVDLWLQTAPSSEGINTSVGSSAKNFVMVLSYCRKAQLK